MSKVPEIVFVLGGPGAGKGTQCELLVKEFGIIHLSAGDLLRQERATKGSEHGELIEQTIREGKIVPVEITVKLLKREIDKYVTLGNKVFLIDGFPRNKDNLDGWERTLGDSVSVRFVLFLDCPEDVMEKRLLRRGETSGRSDDNAEVIKKRFNTYLQETQPIISHYEKLGKVRKIISDNTVEKIYLEVRKMFTNEFPVTLYCPKCGAQEAAPKHCKQPMHIENVDGTDKLVCWMGTKCGSQSLPHHCSQPMKLKFQPTWQPTPTPTSSSNTICPITERPPITDEEVRARLRAIEKLDEEIERRHFGISTKSRHSFIELPAFCGVSAYGASAALLKWRTPKFLSRLPIRGTPLQQGTSLVIAASAAYLAFKRRW